MALNVKLVVKNFLRRALHTVILLIGICILNFFLFQLTPGDATNLYFGPKTKRENLQTLRNQRGLNQPWHEQLTLWGSRFLKGDLGYSWAQHRPVRDILKEAIPATLQLTCLALLVNLALGCIIGIFAGIHSEGRVSSVLDYSTLMVYSIPTFWLALIFISVFSLRLQWLPASQMSSFFAADLGLSEKLWDRIAHLILPVSVLGLTGAAATARYVRSQMQNVLSQDYIRLALAKGLPLKRVYLHHAFKNALIPVVTLIGLYLPFLLGGAFVVEIIFAWPGMGRITYEAIFAKDYPVIMAVNIIAAGMVILGNLLSDLLYNIIDPRIRIDQSD